MMLSILKRRRGSTMVEAAVVFPLVIISVITCILICIFFYSQTIEQSILHIAMRQMAGEVSGRTEYGDTAHDHDEKLSKERAGLFYRIRGKEHVKMKKKGLISGRTEQSIESLWTASDGVTYVRYCTLASNVTEDR